MKIALVFWGLTRSLSTTYPNIKNKILDNLNANKIEYDIYLHSYYFEGEHTDRRTGERNIKLDFDEYKILKPDYYHIDNQDEIKKQIDIQKYHRFRYSYVKKTVENLICALYSQMKATEMVEKSYKKYDYIWYLRPDVIFRDPLPLHWLKWINPGRFIVPAFAHCGGINDRMAVLTQEQASVYGKRFLKIEEYGKLLRGRKFSSEKFIAWVMRNYKARKVNFLFKRLRANGFYNDLDQKLF
jgi:hypothetical protein